MYDIYVYMIMGVHVLLNMVKLWLTTHPTNNNVNHHKCIDITSQLIMIHVDKLT